MKINIPNSVTRMLGKANLQLKKHSPEILLVAGITGLITSAVMACKATTKVEDIMAESKDQVDKIHDVLEDDSVPEESYSVEDSKKDLTIVYTQTCVKFVKLYGPAVVLGAASIACILGSHNILRKRNVALAAAYATIDKGFKEYRGRVIERFGKDLDKELKYNLKAKEIETTTVDEKGETKTEKKIVPVTDSITGYSDYAKIFDEWCTGWSKDPEFNLMYLRRQQDYANDVLKSKGYLFLNEVYQMLGFPVTKAGQCVGWIYDEKNPTGDNYVDFGIYDIYSVTKEQAERRAAFVNGYERSIILDFNVDGDILDNL